MKLSQLILEKDKSEEHSAKYNKVMYLQERIKKNEMSILQGGISNRYYHAHKDILDALEHPEEHIEVLEKYSVQDTIESLDYILKASKN